MSFGTKIDKVYYSGYESQTLDIPCAFYVFCVVLVYEGSCTALLAQKHESDYATHRMIKNEKT